MPRFPLGTESKRLSRPDQVSRQRLDTSPLRRDRLVPDNDWVPADWLRPRTVPAVALVPKGLTQCRRGIDSGWYQRLSAQS